MFKSAPSIRSFLKRGGVFACVCTVGASSACSSDDEGDSTEQATQAATPGASAELSFFVTSTTQDGNLGGLEGADQICENLAAAVGAGGRTWRAYLSAANGGTPIHAKDRIGTGPWYNAMGMLVASDLAALHALSGDEELFITEKGEMINGQWNGSNGMNGTPANEHDIMTGSDSTGSLIMAMDPMTGMMQQTTCDDWTSNTLTPGPQVGHTDGMGPMMSTAEARFTSWNGGHPSRGCSSEALAMSGGAGRFYCFAAD